MKEIEIIDNVRIDHVTKIFDGTLALDDVSCFFEKGKIYGLAGENGAGKSTLVKILNGTIIPNKGCLFINNEKISLSSPSMAAKHGIGMVYQELNLIPNLSVMENIYISSLTDSKIGWIDYKLIKKNTQRYLDMFNLKIDPYEKVQNLKIAYQQIVAIIRAYAMSCSLLILDEPTSALPSKDIQTVLNVVRRLKELGCIVIYISHKLDEYFEVCDTVVALRNGRLLGSLNTGETDKEHLVEIIAGRKLENKFPKKKFSVGQELLRFEKISVPGYLNEISFSLNRGEILGFAGLLGAGKTEVAKTAFGIYGNAYAGDIYLHGEKTIIQKPASAIRKKIGLVPENRGVEGLIHDMTITDNIVLASLKNYSTFGMIKRKEVLKTIRHYVDALKIKCTSVTNQVRNLSGGNQQKVVLAKWITANSDIIIFDEPTRGIDVGAKYEIYNLMNELVEQGIGVMIMSSENDELVNMCDRIVLLREGNMIDIINTEEYSEEQINIILTQDV